ncbi:MAG: hypothetical protein ACREX4_06070 [Gammaproteobacteria bacterium]
MSLSIHPFEAALGAEVRGIDLSSDIDDATFERIKAAWNRYSQGECVLGRKIK